MAYLYDKLKEYSKSGCYGFHMPGHKRNGGLIGPELPYSLDITEIDGFDDLHHSHGILKEAQERAAQVYGADETHFLVNGSTSGILSAVLGCTQPGDTILMARNCHKSVYNAVCLNGLRPVYIYPEILPGTEINGAVSAAQAEALLDQHPDVRAVVITSPTYDGVVSDVRALAGLAHSRGIPLILDEAHGAHFGFHPYFPQNGNELGADIVIHSLHKTLPSLTQTALLHMNGDIADRRSVRKYLHMLQSSSPSYILMASIDECIRLLAEKKEELFDGYTRLLDGARSELACMKHLKLFESEIYDRSKLVIDVSNAGLIDREETKKYTGKQLSADLRETYLLQMEMAAPDYVIAMTSPGDTEQGIERLIKALFEIDGKLAKIDNNESLRAYQTGEKGISCRNDQVYPPREMDKFTNKVKSVSFMDSEGAIAAEYAYVYPPGIPLAVPGERISGKTVESLTQYERLGFNIEGTQIRGKIEVLENG